MRAPLVVFLLLAAPGAAVAVVPTDPSEEIVYAHSWYDYQTGTSCGTFTPVISVASLTLTSRLTHRESAGLTTYTLHLEPVPSTTPCAGIDMEFVSSAAWPAPGAGSSGSIGTACGATGNLHINRYNRDQTYVNVELTSAPPQCGLPFQGAASVSAQISPITQGYAACTPVVVSRCAGAWQGEYYDRCPEKTDHFIIEANDWRLIAGHRCDDSTGAEYGYVDDPFGAVTVRGEQDSCSLTVSDPFLGLVYESFECPAELGSAIDDQDWSRVLP